MNTNTTLNNAILNFAFTGVMQPHKQPETARPVSLIGRLIPRRK